MTDHVDTVVIVSPLAPDNNGHPSRKSWDSCPFRFGTKRKDRRSVLVYNGLVVDVRHSRSADIGEDNLNSGMFEFARARWLMAPALLSLLFGLWAALIRIGWDLPALQPSMANAHGPLMVSGFLGTLVCLERAVALSKRWAFTAPLLTGLGALIVLFGWTDAGALLITLGSLIAIMVHAFIMRRHAALYTLTMLVGSLCWFSGNLSWLFGNPIYQVVLWWAAFLVLIIAGERLELSRVLQLDALKQASFATAVGLLLAGLVLTLLDFNLGVRLTGVGNLALALWLLTHDIARRTIRRTGLTRYIAVSLMAGYVWLAFSGTWGVMVGDVRAGLQYDALLHGIFLGFVFSMLFAHAPIILPAVLHVALPYRSTLYVHLVLLHFSLILRVGGDLLVMPGVRQWGGLLNVVAILWFLASTARVVFSERMQRTGSNPV